MELVRFNADFYMDLALRCAWDSQLLALPNPSVGALILDKHSRIIALEAHSKSGEPHAELKACKNAYIALKGDDFEALQNLTSASEIYDFLLKNHKGILRDCSIFITLEPCNHYGKTPPCAELLKALEIKQIFFSVDENSADSRGGADNLAHFGAKITRGILRDKGEDLLYPFVKLRDSGTLRVFKVAQRLNGSFENGIISSHTSRTYSHKLRAIAHQIIISAKTILNDNPLLDSRLSGGHSEFSGESSAGKAPNVCILGSSESLKKCEDRNLHIYSVPNRAVSFYDNVDSLPAQGFSIIEGGADMFESLKDKIDLLLIFISAKMARGRNFHSDFGGRILWANRVGEDIALWIKPS